MHIILIKISNKLKRQLDRFFRLFIFAPKEWKLPRRSDVLLYDAMASRALTEYLAPYSFEILFTDGEVINVRCFLRAMLMPTFWMGRFFNCYANAYISAVKPKVLITFIDNNIRFYEKKLYFPNIKTISLQNGGRMDNDYFFYALKQKKTKLHVDYMLVHNPDIGRYYEKYLSGHFISIGSLKNNMVDITRTLSGIGVVYISQWRPRPRENEIFYETIDGDVIDWDRFYTFDVNIVKFLDGWCSANKKQLKICGATPNTLNLEQDFYATYLKTCEWEFIPKRSELSAYQVVDSSEMVVFINSTLGYEAIGRGKKTACFSCKSGAGRLWHKFGWPADFPSDGPFWTCEPDETQFQRILDYLLLISEEDWMRTLQQYRSNLMDFDKGNTKLTKLLRELLTPSDKEGIEHYAN